MTTYYADSSALVKRYVLEKGSVWIQQLCDPAAGHVIALAHIGLVEIAAALSAKNRQGILPTTILDNLLSDLQQDASTQYWLVDVNQAVVVRAMSIARQRQLRGYDAVHAACALLVQDALLARNLPAPIVLSADRDLLAAVQAEGMAVDDPNMHP